MSLPPSPFSLSLLLFSFPFPFFSFSLSFSLCLLLILYSLLSPKVHYSRKNFSLSLHLAYSPSNFTFQAGYKSHSSLERWGKSSEAQKPSARMKTPHSTSLKRSYWEKDHLENPLFWVRGDHLFHSFSTGVSENLEQALFPLYPSLYCRVPHKRMGVSRCCTALCVLLGSCSCSVMVQKHLLVPVQQCQCTPYSKVIAWLALSLLCFF